MADIGVCVSMAKQQCEKVAEDSLYVTLELLSLGAAKLQRLQR